MRRNRMNSDQMVFDRNQILIFAATGMSTVFCCFYTMATIYLRVMLKKVATFRRTNMFVSSRYDEAMDGTHHQYLEDDALREKSRNVVDLNDEQTTNVSDCEHHVVCVPGWNVRVSH